MIYPYTNLAIYLPDVLYLYGFYYPSNVLMSSDIYIVVYNQYSFPMFVMEDDTSEGLYGLNITYPSTISFTYVSTNHKNPK